MSNAIFPTLIGIGWNITKQPEYKTTVQKAVSGRELRIAFMTYPMYTFGLNYEILRDDRTTLFPTSPKDELKKIAGFFLARQGSWDSFLYSDPTDNTVTAQAVGTGDGVNTKFQLCRTFGYNGIVEQVQNPNTYTVYINDVSTTAYTISNGLVTFTTAPASGALVTWTGTYYYRVRFNKDTAQFNQFMYDLWELKSLDLYGSLSNKV